MYLIDLKLVSKMSGTAPGQGLVKEFHTIVIFFFFLPFVTGRKLALENQPG